MPLRQINNISKYNYILLSIVVIILALFQCKEKIGLSKSEIENGGLFLPDGFEAIVVADSIGHARHLAVNHNGDIYVKLQGAKSNSGNVALRDTNGDGIADSIVYFGDYKVEGGYGPTSMRIYNDYIYFSTKESIFRYKLTPGKLIPENEIELVLTDDYKIEHIGKALAFDNEGHMYVGFGSISNACQIMNRVPESFGQDPCLELANHAGVWRFDANKLEQTQKDGKKYATGIRSIIAMDWNHADQTLYALQHGRDDLHRTWPNLFTPWESAMLPAEEFFKIEEGMDGGWPYYYYDQIQNKKILSPEYGGDGKKQGDGDSYALPLIGFPGHWAPNDLLFYSGDQFPEHYKNGAFIAFHGSANRAPYPQSGYFVCFVPFENGVPSHLWEVFADGFAKKDTIVNSSDASYRPMGLAMGPDGALYISDDVKGKIWKITFTGVKKDFGTIELADMEKRKMNFSIKTPDRMLDNLDKEMAIGGEKIYNNYCAPCHQADGKGDGSRFPSLSKTEWVIGEKERLIRVMLNGITEPIIVNGQSFDGGVMPKHDFLSNAEIANVLTYIRKNFNNNASNINESDVIRVRSKSKRK